MSTDLPETAVPLARWMERALYDPEGGYYTRHIRTVGRGGDFSTTATLCPELGRGIARWIAGELAFHQGAVQDVIEVGAGDGSLLRSVLRHRSLRERILPGGARYHIVETSPVLHERQRAKLGRRVRWHADMGAALEASAGAALVFSNELVDAFPVTQVAWSEAEKGWRELWIDPSGHPPREFWQPFDPPPEVELSGLQIEGWPTPPREGHRVDLHLSYRAWLGGWLPQLERGSLLTIDYGGTAPAIAHGNPRGTLRAYLLHERLTGPDVFLNPGRQDLTADVNFTDLIAWGREFGLEDLPLQTQREFLLEARPVLADSNDPALRMVLDPDGAGRAFQVLRQRT